MEKYYKDALGTEMLNKITAGGNRNLFISSHVFKIFEPFLHHLKLCK